MPVGRDRLGEGPNDISESSRAGKGGHFRGYVYYMEGAGH